MENPATHCGPFKESVPNCVQGCTRSQNGSNAHGVIVTHIEYNDDGTRNFYISGDALYASELLDHEGAPELTPEKFEELTEEMRKARDAVDQSEEEGSA